jgi:glucose/arabinose dehydrogenase
VRLSRLGLLVVTAGLAASACQASGPVTSPAREQRGISGPALTSVTLTVPVGAQHGPFATPRTLKLPKGWTASLWAIVPNARMAAWTPQGNLLVSQPDHGRVVELTPAPSGKLAASTVLLSGLTWPQGLAFGRFDGRSVLYVAESDQLDRYNWTVTKNKPSGGVGKRVVIAARLPDLKPAGDDIHRAKDVAIGANGAIYFNVGSSSNASPDDRTFLPQRAVIMSVRPDGKALNVAMRGVRNGEGLARAPDGSMWTAVNNRDNISYPYHSSYAGIKDPFGKVIQAYVNNHPPDEVVPVTVGRDLGWPYCNPAVTPTMTHLPLIPDALNDPGGNHLKCSQLSPIQAGLPAHSAPLGLTFLEGSKLPAPWSGGAVIAAHGSWNRQPPRPPALLWLRWNAKKHTLEAPEVLAAGFQNPDGTRWARPVDAVPGPDGALYVTDDQAGAIFRLAPPSAN